jgi:hypothetical protein
VGVGSGVPLASLDASVRETDHVGLRQEALLNEREDPNVVDDGSDGADEPEVLPDVVPERCAGQPEPVGRLALHDDIPVGLRLSLVALVEEEEPELGQLLGEVSLSGQPGVEALGRRHDDRLVEVSVTAAHHADVGSRRP